MKKNYLNVFKKTIKEYEKEGIIFATTNDPRSFCYPCYNLVCMYEKMHEFTTIEDLFDLFHEIGHIKANKPGMLRWEEEATATQWAINKCKSLHIDIPINIEMDFENYICEWVNFAIKHHSKRIPDQDKRVLYW